MASRVRFFNPGKALYHRASGYFFIGSDVYRVDKEELKRISGTAVVFPSEEHVSRVGTAEYNGDHNRAMITRFHGKRPIRADQTRLVLELLAYAARERVRSHPVSGGRDADIDSVRPGAS